MHRLRRTRCRRRHSKTTCLAVSHCAPQQQAGVGKPGTCRLQRTAASLILPVRGCVRMLLWALDRPARSRRVARYGILSGFQSSPPSGSGSSSWTRGGGPPWSSCHRSQHHCSDSKRACQTVRGRGGGGGGGRPGVEWLRGGCRPTGVGPGSPWCIPVSAGAKGLTLPSGVEPGLVRCRRGDVGPVVGLAGA